ncbi:MAG TPA: hypothetical protein VE993_12610 [Stellaceae bacterium]|nr:hypothetical protein [Stellaceae bacterium]
MVTLIVPPGAADYPIAHGTEPYHPYRADHADPASQWLVDVPEAVAAHLLHVGGFAVAKKETAPAPQGMVAMRHPESIGCSFAGQTYGPDADGFVSVPAEAAAALAAHGFVAVEES